MVTSGVAMAQQETAPEGMTVISGGQHLTLITDLPVDQEMLELPVHFERAMQTWREQFSVTSEETKGWKVTMYLMLDRQRFQSHDLIPPDLPEFQHGWQSGDKIWINEQPGPYYRRHLMLHEGTHWFMSRKYGKYHAPWLMEGLAEWLGTHRLHENRLELGIVPGSKWEVPFWGRISLIQEQTVQGVAPSLEQVWRYSDSAHRQIDAYAWSWAVVLFLNTHPDTSGLMSAMLRQPAMDAPSLERWLRSRLRSKMPRIRAEWIAFVSELDYGYTSRPGLLQISKSTEEFAVESTLEIQAHLGWQATGLSVQSAQLLEVTASGEFSIASDPKPWVCYSDGVSLEYHRGQPVGKLMMTVLSPIEKEPDKTPPLTWIPIGSKAQVKAPQAGEMFFRINEANANLSDNAGSIRIRISAKKTE